VRYEQIAVRAYGVPAEFTRESEGGTRKKKQRPELSDYALIIDTETTTDPSQALLFGSARVIAINSDRHARGTCVQETIFYGDDLPTRNPFGFATLQHYVSVHESDLDVWRYRKPLRFCSRREFIDRDFWKLAYKARYLVVGFNLAFDLPRLAVKAGSARQSYGGGFSLTLWDYKAKNGERRDSHYRPRLIVKSLGSKGQLIRFSDRHEGDPNDYDHEKLAGGKTRRHAFGGHFLDLHTLGFALANANYSLAKACEAFGVEHAKIEAEEHGVITPAYIDYNRRDVKATGELLVKLLAEFEQHPVNLQVTKAYSPASLAKSYLDVMGIAPPLRRQRDFPKDVLGYAMGAYYGGRAECRIRNTQLPVTYLDFLSMYPTVNALMGNWSLLTAKRIETVDATKEVLAFVSALTLEDCFDPETWRRLAVFVQVQAAGEVYPVRTRYEPGGQSYGIGSNKLTRSEPTWYALADVIAAMLLSGHAPKIVRAVRLVASGTQSGLRATKLSGRVRVDPVRDDFFRAVIEERKRTQGNSKLEAAERDRLQKALKVIANAGSYGIFAEMNRKELPGGERATVELWGLEGEPFTNRLATPEEPGPYCFPPLAALITAGAKLMLALLESVVTARGGSYVFCDTDSMAIVASENEQLLPCVGGPHNTGDGNEAVKALAWCEVDEIAQLFENLKPYDPGAVPGSVLELEEYNFDEPTGERRELYCYSISAKRYALYNLEDGEPVIRKASRHGLGHLLNPKDPDKRDDSWVDEVWAYIVRKDVLGLPAKEPSWIARPAVGRVGVSSPQTLALFRDVNRGKAYADQVKPGNFMLSAQVADFGHPRGVDVQHFHLIAPYNPDPRQWLKMRWIDRYSGKTYRVTLSEHATLEAEARLKSYGDVVLSYRFHPEFKSDGPGGEACDRRTRGLLRRTSIEATGVVYIGKESNKLEETEDGLIHDLDEVLNEYHDARGDVFTTLVLPVLRTMPLRVIVAESGLNPSTAKRIRAGGQRPHPRNLATLSQVAARYARAELARSGRSASPHDAAAMYVYLR
jgi:hypothetical protein